MRERRLATVLLMVCIALFVAGPVLSQELPKPGTVIDKNNYTRYAHLWPTETLRLFTDGYGLQKPISITVGETKSYPMPKEFLALSAQNKGKYSVDKDGNIVGGWKRNGLPFPDLKPGDKDFLTKLMWNYEGRYVLDDQIQSEIPSWQIRKGEDMRWTTPTIYWLYLTNRIAHPPKPIWNNPSNLAKAMLLHYMEPPSMRNTMTLSWRYMDPNKVDDTYIYLPNMRRVLRGEAGQRSVPVMGVISALDDFNVFDGRTPEFTYKLVGEQKMLACTNNTLHPDQLRAKQGWPLKEFPYPTTGWEVVDTYVIDIFPKDPKYPQSRKRIWIDKQNLHAYHGVGWDRAGTFWKFWMAIYEVGPMPADAPILVFSAFHGHDVQFGMNTMAMATQKFNTGKVKYEDVLPASLVKRGR
jgi:hypothetical protein